MANSTYPSFSINPGLRISPVTTSISALVIVKLPPPPSSPSTISTPGSKPSILKRFNLNPSGCCGVSFIVLDTKESSK